MRARNSRVYSLGMICLLAMAMSWDRGMAADADRIQPYPENPTYWQYKGEPVLLLGGTDQDNLFNHPNIGPDGLEAHLDLLASVGGNYVRNTMSSRDRANSESNFHNDDNLHPFHWDEATGLYDLNQWDEGFWQRFRDFLEMTAKRDIIVQIEIWDRWDVGPDNRADIGQGWSTHPLNPKNNVNYTSDQTGLSEQEWQGYPIFRTLPDLDDVPVVLAYQEAFVAKMLSISLNYGHVLYCVSNETTSPEQWSTHWARFVRSRAQQAGRGVEVTEMWNHWDLTHPMHRRTFDHPKLYSFADTSQNNHQTGQTHWDNMQAARKLVADPPRPMNNVKIYGGDPHGGGLVEGTRKMWHNVLGGLASSRFHRPASGAGLSELAQTHLRSMRLLTAEFDVFSAEPDNALLSERAENEAYCMATPGKQYAVFFPDGGAVKLDVSAADGPLEVRWLDIERSAWQPPQTADGGGTLELKTPGKGHWAVLVLAR